MGGEESLCSTEGLGQAGCRFEVSGAIVAGDPPCTHARSVPRHDPCPNGVEQLAALSAPVSICPDPCMHKGYRGEARSTPSGMSDEVPRPEPSSGPSFPGACTISSTSSSSPSHASSVPEASPFEGVPGFSSQFSFWSWATALPRLVLSSRTSFAKFLRVSFCVRERGHPASDTALFPLPVPSITAFRPGLSLRAAPGCDLSAGQKELILERALHVLVMSLNYLHADFRHIPLCSLRLQPSALQVRIFSRLRGLLWACSDKGHHALNHGRRGPHMIARLRELSLHLSELGLSTFPYPRGETFSGYLRHTDDGPEALRPYREVDPGRLKISGEGQWRLQEYLGPELLLPYLEPKVLRGIPPNALPFPQTAGEDPLSTLELLKLWDSRGLLYLSFEEKGEREVTRVFAAYKSEVADRQIGDRRGVNSLEGKLHGPSRLLPPGHLLINLTVPAGMVAVGAVTDRSDFYHQAAVSAARAETNVVGPRMTVRDVEGTGALHDARLAVLEARRRGAEEAEVTAELAALRYVSPQVPPSLLFDPSTPVYGAFRSLYQGDHAGVEFATEAHSGLLQAAGLLSHPGRLLAKTPVSRQGPWQALIIDDYFSLSAEDPSTPLAESAATHCVLTAKHAYSASGVAGSDHKDVLGTRITLAAGAQVDSSEITTAWGNTLVSSPTGKLLALSIISLRAAALPAITEELAAGLAGSWISALMFRRSLFATLDKFFRLARPEVAATSGSQMHFLPRKEAEELVLLASLVPVMTSNISAEFSDLVICSDASNLKGAFCSSAQPATLSASLWLSADKKGAYTMLGGSEPVTEHFADEAFPAPPEEGSSSKPYAFDYDVLCLLAGSGEVATECKSSGLRASAVIDLSVSPELDLLSLPVVEWILHLLWSRRTRSVVVAVPSGDPRQGSNLKAARKESREKLLKRIVAIFKLCVRAECPCLLLFRRGSGFLSYAEASGLLNVPGVVSLPPGAESGLRGERTRLCDPGLLFSPAGVPPEFWTSRAMPGAAEQGLMQLFRRFADQSGGTEKPCAAGLESLAVNDLLLSGAWRTEAVWRWSKPRHINALETEAAVSALRCLARGGKDQRVVMILDSACARGALAKGRSSARLLQPSLRRAAAICVAGGLYPAFLFGPTRLNVSDDPTRDTELRDPVPLSCARGLDENSAVKLCGLSGLSKPRSGWLRLCLLLCPDADRTRFVEVFRSTLAGPALLSRQPLFSVPSSGRATLPKPSPALLCKTSSLPRMCLANSSSSYLLVARRGSAPKAGKSTGLLDFTPKAPSGAYVAQPMISH